MSKKKGSKVKRKKNTEKDEKEERRKDLVRQATYLKEQIGKEKEFRKNFDERLEKLKHFWETNKEEVKVRL